MTSLLSNFSSSTSSSTSFSLGPPTKRVRNFMKNKKYPFPLVENEKLQFEKNTLCTYNEELMEYYNFLNHHDLPDPKMLRLQPEIGDSFEKIELRSQHLDFIINLHSFLQLKQETLYLTVYLHDKYCSKRIVYKKHYLLVMLTSLWIASKYLDKKQKIPNLNELCYFANNYLATINNNDNNQNKNNDRNMKSSINYDSTMFVQMEQHICTTLNWEIGTTITQEEVLQIIFMNISKSNTNNLKTAKTYSQEDILKIYQVASFLCEYSMYFENFMYFNKNIISNVSVLLATKIYNMDSSFNHDWMTTGLIDSFFNTTTDLNELRKCCHCFLNEVFNIYPLLHAETPLNSDTPLQLKGKILFKKYKLINISELLAQFTEYNYKAYFKLGYLSETSAALNSSAQNNNSANHIMMQIISITDYFLNTPTTIHQSSKWCDSLVFAETSHNVDLYGEHCHYGENGINNRDYHMNDSPQQPDMDEDSQSYYSDESPNGRSTISSASSMFESPSFSQRSSTLNSQPHSTSNSYSCLSKTHTPLTPMPSMFMFKSIQHHSTQQQQTLNQ